MSERAAPVPSDAASVPSPAPSAIRVRREIWRSLVSMLRVYAHAAEMNHGRFQVTETGSGRVVVESREAELRLSFEEDSGAGSWERWRNVEWKTGLKAGLSAKGRFSILADGRMDFDGEEKQLDSAAIDWVEDLTRAASRQQAS